MLSFSCTPWTTFTNICLENLLLQFTQSSKRRYLHIAFSRSRYHCITYIRNHKIRQVTKSALLQNHLSCNNKNMGKLSILKIKTFKKIIFLWNWKWFQLHRLSCAYSETVKVMDDYKKKKLISVLGEKKQSSRLR